MVTKEQVVQGVFENLICPAVACNETMSVIDRDHKTVIETASGPRTQYVKEHALTFHEDGTAVTVINGVEYKLKMTVELVSERKIEEEYKRAETPRQLIGFCKDASPGGVKISEMTAQAHLQEFNEGMAALECEGRSVLDVDSWIADFIDRIDEN